MHVTSTLELDSHRLDWHDSLRCTARLNNPGPGKLLAINRETHGAVPTVLLTDERTGETTAHARRARGSPDDVIRDVAGGGERTDVFELWARVQLPGPGRYSLRVRYTWTAPHTEDGEAGAPACCESEPVAFEVVGSRPRAVHLVPATGGPCSEYLAGWCEAGRQVVLASLVALHRPAWSRRRVVAAVDAEVEPVVSVPARGRGRWRDHVGWVSGGSLVVVTLDGPRPAGTARVAVDGGTRVVSLLEHDSRAGHLLGVDVLLARADAGSFELRAARVLVGQEPALSPVLMRRAGPAPAWMQVAYRHDGRRDVLWLEAMSGRTALVRWRWPTDGAEPAEPEVLTDWRGRAVRAHLALGGCEQICVAVLLESPDDALTLVTIRLDEHDALETLAETAVRGVAPLRAALVHVDGDGGAVAMLRSVAMPGRWSRVNGDGAAVLVAAELAQPLAIFAARRTLHAVDEAPDVGLVLRTL